MEAKRPALLYCVVRIFVPFFFSNYFSCSKEIAFNHNKNNYSPNIS